MELGTGSGFVISPSGYVLTNHHVVTGEQAMLERGGRPVRLTLEVKRIEVILPADGTRLEAHVEASDPDLDVAVLSVAGTELPSIGLGDSDALQAGEPVVVVGFPFGRAVEAGRTVTAATVPQPSVSRGTIAAVREGEEGEARYLQTDATVNPGSSGGPMLDEDGRAVGVVRMSLARGVGLGFGIPINRVKDFLEAKGFDRVFPARRLRLGPVQPFSGKGLRLRRRKRSKMRRHPGSAWSGESLPRRSASSSKGWPHRWGSPTSSRCCCRARRFPASSRRPRQRREARGWRDGPPWWARPADLRRAPAMSRRWRWSTRSSTWAPRRWSPATSARRTRSRSTGPCCAARC